MCMYAPSCPTLCDPMDCSPPGSSVLGILQARILEWVAISFSRGSSQPTDRTCVSYVSCVGRQVLLPAESPGLIKLKRSRGKGLRGPLWWISPPRLGYTGCLRLCHSHDPWHTRPVSLRPLSTIPAQGFSFPTLITRKTFVISLLKFFW